MTDIFNKYTELDPSLEAAQIEAKVGAPVFDKYSFLDEARFNAQAAAALGGTLDLPALLDPARARAEFEAMAAADTGGGGGGGPAWLPAAATTFADFVNGHYWDGTAETIAVAMFKSDDFDGDPFVPSDIVAGVGYYDVTATNGAEAAGQYQGVAALSAVSEFVFVIELSLGGSGTANFALIAYDDATIAATTPATSLSGFIDALGHVSLANNTSSNEVHDNVGLSAGTNRIAFRCSLSKLSVSANGRAAVSVDDISPNPIKYLTFYTNTSGSSDCKIRSVTTYPNSTLDADLSTLTALS